MCGVDLYERVRLSVPGQRGAFGHFSIERGTVARMVSLSARQPSGPRSEASA